MTILFEPSGPQLARDGADKRGAEDDPRKRDREDEDCGKRQDGERPEKSIFQHAAADAPRCERNNRRDRWLNAIEQAADNRRLAKGYIKPRQANQNQQRGQNEQRAGDNAALDAMHQPADVGGELLRFRAGQEHAIVQCMKKALFGDPAAFLHQLLVHDGDLTRWPAEANAAEFQPIAQRRAERDGVDGTRIGHGSKGLLVRQFFCYLSGSVTDTNGRQTCSKISIPPN